MLESGSLPMDCTACTTGVCFSQTPVEVGYDSYTHFYILVGALFVNKDCLVCSNILLKDCKANVCVKMYLFADTGVTCKLLRRGDFDTCCCNEFAESLQIMVWASLWKTIFH